MTQSTSTRRVASFTPGSLILYRETRSDLPLWPSVCLTEDVAPHSFLQTRPSGFYSVVLKLASALDASQLRWALTSEMNPFDPFAADDSTKRSTPGLEDAYNVAHEAEESGFDLAYWKAILASSQDQEIITIDSDDDDDDDKNNNDHDHDDWDDDPEMRLAIDMGIIDVSSQNAHRQPKPPMSRAKSSTAWPNSSPPGTGRFESHPYNSELSLPGRSCIPHPCRLPTPTPSPSSKANPFATPSQLPKRPGPTSPANHDDDLPSPRRRKLSYGPETLRRADSFQSSSQSSQSIESPTYVLSDEDDTPLPSGRRKSSTATGLNPSRHLPQQSAFRSKKAPQPNLSAQQVFLRNGLNVSASAVPDDDIIEEDFAESSQFVQVFVGPEVDPASNNDIDPERQRHKLQLLKHHVWERPYFRDTLSGRNYFEPIGDNTWELAHPRLVDISPEDFRMVAEFLSDDDFGIRDPETEEQVAETFAECMAAWKTAELLSMDDLLDRIVEKIRATRPWWDLWNVMAFACSIYQSDVSLQAHDDLKELFSEYIADLFYIYVEDDHLSGTFLTRLKQLPELERDVLTKRIAQLEGRPQLQEEEAVPQEEDAVNDRYLYN